MRLTGSTLGLMLLGASLAAGQTYPNKPIRILASEAGSEVDIAARKIAPAISVTLGQPVIVDNRPGNISPELVAKATPDGYTLLMIAGSLWIGPLMQKTSYDPVKDFLPITLIYQYPLVVVVNPNVPAQSVAELIALAKAKPGALNYGRGATGGSSHLGAELLKSMAGVNIVQIAYKGSGPALQALVAGEVQVMVNNAASAAPLVKSGRLRALAVTSAAPSPLAPGLPTVAASLPGYEFEQLLGAFTTAGTPAAIVTRLNREMVRFLQRPDVKEQFFNAGAEVVASSSEALSARMKVDMARMGKVIRDAGIRVE
jgi:tripartite-type tricarboxylate transporter receptor subunit TctC